MQYIIIGIIMFMVGFNTGVGISKGFTYIMPDSILVVNYALLAFLITSFIIWHFVAGAKAR